MLALEGRADLLSPGPYSLVLKGIPCIEARLVLSVSEFYSLSVYSVPPTPTPGTVWSALETVCLL